jgi:hypothetical protein
MQTREKFLPLKTAEDIDPFVLLTFKVKAADSRINQKYRNQVE